MEIFKQTDRLTELVPKLLLRLKYFAYQTLLFRFDVNVDATAHVFALTAVDMVRGYVIILYQKLYPSNSHIIGGL